MKPAHVIQALAITALFVGALYVVTAIVLAKALDAHYR